MNEKGMRKTLLLVLALLAAVPLAGCLFEEKYPFYQMETCEDNSELLYMDDVQYRRKSGGEDEQAYYHSGGCQYNWTPAEGIGAQIGVCGKDAGEKPSLKIYEVVGDEEHFFLHTWPANFYFGGTDIRLWMRDGVTLEVPAAETVSSITIVPEKDDGDLVQLDDPVLIAGLLELYYSDDAQTTEKFRYGEDWLACTLIMRHKEFPFLQYSTKCCYAPEQKMLYWERGKYKEWLVLPLEQQEALQSSFQNQMYSMYKHFSNSASYNMNKTDAARVLETLAAFCLFQTVSIHSWRKT